MILRNHAEHNRMVHARRPRKPIARPSCRKLPAICTVESSLNSYRKDVADQYIHLKSEECVRRQSFVKNAIAEWRLEDLKRSSDSTLNFTVNDISNMKPQAPVCPSLDMQCLSQPNAPYVPRRWPELPSFRWTSWSFLIRPPSCIPACCRACW